LFLQAENDKYVLYSHNSKVKPENVSAGERNAIALAYFFNKLKENKRASTMADIYGQPCILVIDDPISSLDMDNRIGMLSYLKHEIFNYAHYNNKTKILIMTHDIQVLFDLNHIISGFSDEGGHKYSYATMQLCYDHSIQIMPANNHNEYSSLLRTIYDYVLNNNDERYKDREIIGNVMRRELEAYATFTYKMGIEKITTDKKILSLIENDDDRMFFENLVFRLVLHTGSHLQEKVESANDFTFFDYISDEEKCVTAKSIICFMYALNSTHVIIHLASKNGTNETEIKENICKWAGDLGLKGAVFQEQRQ
jgi:wobble nucleotide-excising tRNase